MGNYGTNMGKNNEFSGETTINNKTVNKPVLKWKTKVVVVFSFFILLAGVIFLLTMNAKPNIVGVWETENGNRIEFLSDGTFHEEGHYTDLNANTYEITDEGYLKMGEYDAGWLQYRYVYADMEIKGKTMTLTRRDYPDETVQLTKIE